MSDKIMVSISCLVYNHEKYIRQCLDGMLMQKTDFKYEILIHDDASTDGSADIIREYENKYPDIVKPIYQRENQFSKGVSVTWKYQYPRAKGKYIALCEGDDFWTDPNKLQKQFDLLEGDDSIIISTHAVHFGREDGQLTGSFLPETIGENRIIPSPDFIRSTVRETACPYHTSSFFFRKEIFGMLDYKLPRFHQTCKVGDYSLLLLLASRGGLGYIADVMSYYRFMSIGSWSSKTVRNRKNMIEHTKNMKQTLLEYDEYTNHVYNKDISDTVIKCEFNILWWERRFSELKKPPYKKAYDKLSRKGKIYLYLNAYLPSSSGIYRKFKSKRK